MERQNVNKLYLKNEYLVLYSLQNSSRSSKTQQKFPKIYQFFESHSRNFYTMDLLGPSLSSLIASNERGDKSILLELYDSLEDLHSRGFIHLDIKPSNFAISRTYSSDKLIYLVDFGLARSFKHISVEFGILNLLDDNNFVGTLKYASLNAHKRFQPLSMTDDLWSLYFITLELCNVQLPWNIKINKNEMTGKEAEAVISAIKHLFINQSYFLEYLKDNIFFEPLRSLFNYLKGLSHLDMPDYVFIRSIIKSILELDKTSQSCPRYKKEFSICMDKDSNAIIVDNKKMYIGENMGEKSDFSTATKEESHKIEKFSSEIIKKSAKQPKKVCTPNKNKAIFLCRKVEKYRENKRK